MWIILRGSSLIAFMKKINNNKENSEVDPNNSEVDPNSCSGLIETLNSEGSILLYAKELKGIQNNSTLVSLKDWLPVSWDCLHYWWVLRWFQAARLGLERPVHAQPGLAVLDVGLLGLICLSLPLLGWAYLKHSYLIRYSMNSDLSLQFVISYGLQFRNLMWKVHLIFFRFI